MKSRNRRKKRSRSPTPAAAPPPAPAPKSGSAPRRSLRLAIAAVGLVVLVGVGLWLSGVLKFGSSKPKPADSEKKTEEVAREEKPKKAKPPKSSLGGSLMEQFGSDDKENEEGGSGAVLSSADLENKYKALMKLQTRMDALDERFGGGATNQEDLRAAFLEKKQLKEDFDKGSIALQEDLKRARKDRPKDPVPQWLTGELLRRVGGEPQEALPYLEEAARLGLDRPEFLLMLSRVRFESNRFEPALQSAVKLLSGSSPGLEAWVTYTRVAFGMQKFAEVIDRIDRSFPKNPPAWAAKIRKDAAEMLPLWREELKLRAAEEKADNLPRVRLVIEHRRYAHPDGEGQPLKIEATGREEVILELYEDQAPATVANFLDLVSHGFYNQTRFHLAQSAQVVLGGDPNTKSAYLALAGLVGDASITARSDPNLIHADTSEDGKGGPGYVIPDEYRRKTARKNWRGSIAMYNTGPRTAGSQFFITLTPDPYINGRYTVFGRVIKGQEAVDRVTQGQTFGKGLTIPGDAIIRAEVIRKRPHAYKVIKEKP